MRFLFSCHRPIVSKDIMGCLGGKLICICPLGIPIITIWNNRSQNGRSICKKVYYLKWFTLLCGKREPGWTDEVPVWNLTFKHVLVGNVTAGFIVEPCFNEIEEISPSGALGVHVWKQHIHHFNKWRTSLHSFVLMLMFLALKQKKILFRCHYERGL